MASDTNRMEIVNEILKSDYGSLDEVPDEGLHRVCLILQISKILRENPDIAVFICRKGDIQEGSQ